MKKLAFAASALLLVAACHGHLAPRLEAGPEVLCGFERTRWKDPAGRSHVVYASKTDGPAVIILHEGPGMLYEDIRVGQILASNGFRVYMPLLFGRVGERSNANLWRACTSGGFHCFRNEPPEILQWLGPFIDEKSQQKPVGVIGMCLSGAVPFALLDHADVRVAVMSQPALPMTSKHALGVTEPEVDAARAAIKRGAKILYFRFSGDSISPPERFAAFGKAVPEIERRELTPAPDRHGAHSVLALEYVEDPKDPSNQAVRRIIEVLKDRLGS